MNILGQYVGTTWLFWILREETSHHARFSLELMIAVCVYILIEWRVGVKILNPSKRDGFVPKLINVVGSSLPQF